MWYERASHNFNINRIEISQGKKFHYIQHTYQFYDFSYTKIFFYNI